MPKTYHLLQTNILQLGFLEFNNPNSLELVMAYHPLPGKSLMCLKSPTVVGLPINQVQTDFPDNRHGNSYSTLALNELFLADQRLEWRHLVNSSFDGQ
jgi:hypothetical protein